VDYFKPRDNKGQQKPQSLPFVENQTRMVLITKCENLQSQARTASRIWENV